MWITGGNNADCDPINLDQVLTIQSGRVDGDHYGIYAVVRYGEDWKSSEKYVLTQIAHNNELDGYTEHQWSTPAIQDILNAIERGIRVYDFRTLK